VPEVLLSGHHERIDAWRRERSSERGERRGDATREARREE
jgi:tRNA G37 N-methylase TrmD